MGQPLLRKTRIAPGVETLEDRRLLSHFGPPSGGDDATWSMADHADLAPPIRGPMLGSGDEAITPWSGTGASLNAPGEKTPGDHDPALTLMINPLAGNHPFATQPGRWPEEGPNSTGNTPVEQALPYPETSSQPAEKAALSDTAAAVAPHGPVGDPTVGESTFVAASIPSLRSISPSGPTARSVGSFVATSHVENDAATRPESTEHSTLDESSLSGLATLPADPEAGPASSSHGSATFDRAIGPGSTAALARPLLDVGTAKGTTEGRSPVEAPRSAIWDPEKAEGRIGSETLAPGQSGEETDGPDPQLADMIMNLWPFDRSSLGSVVDHYLGSLDDLSAAMPAWNGPLGLLAATSLTLAVTVLAVDVSLRIRQSRDQDGEMDGDPSFVGFPGLPGLGRGSHP